MLPLLLMQFVVLHRFFILFAISIVAVALVEVASYVIEKQEIMFKKTQVQRRIVYPFM